MKRILIGLFVLLLILGGLIAYAASPAVSAASMPADAIIRFPWGADSPQAKPALKVITYNIGYASGDKNNRPIALTEQEVRSNLDSMVAELARVNADVLCLQEVDFNSARTFGINQMEYLAKGLNLAHGAYVLTWNKRHLPWPYWPLAAQYGRMVSGQAVLSRYPIRAQELVRFEKPAANAFWYNWFYLDRIAQKISMEAGSDLLRVWNIHLEAFDPKGRLEQADLLSREVAKDRWPYQLALGDYNSLSQARPDRENQEDSGEALELFLRHTGFRNAEGTTPLYTMPSWDAERKIDHVLYNEGFEMRSAGSFATTASDHLPVWAELEWIR